MVIYCSKPFQPTLRYHKPYDRHQNHPSRCCSYWVMSKFHLNLVYFLFQKKRQLSRPPPQTKKSFFEILQKRTSFSNCLLNTNPEWKHRFFEYFDFESRMTYPNQPQVSMPNYLNPLRYFSISSNFWNLHRQFFRGKILFLNQNQSRTPNEA